MEYSGRIGIPAQVGSREREQSIHDPCCQAPACCHPGVGLKCMKHPSGEVLQELPAQGVTWWVSREYP